MRISRLVQSVAILAFSLPLLAAATAAAAPVTIGPPLATTAFNTVTCANPGCTETHLTLTGGALTTSPVDGTIVSWSLKGASATPGYALHVETRSGKSLTGVATSATVTPAGSGLETFATSMPIKQGQTVGVTFPTGSGIGVAVVPGVVTGEIAGSLPDGTTGTATEFPNEEVGFSVQIQRPPTITSIAPTSGPQAGGTQVSITGTELEGATAVKFGSSSALSFSVASETQINAVAPSGTSPVTVTVTTPAGTATASQAFGYTAPPAPPAPPAPTCKVPKLKGKTLKSAKKRIRAADCRVGKLTKKEGATAKDGEVVKQVPKPGATVPTTTKVKVTLAP
jgi:PASTA domain-containing protein/IPT/TIG domain-containing protein